MLDLFGAVPDTPRQWNGREKKNCWTGWCGGPIMMVIIYFLKEPILWACPTSVYEGPKKRALWRRALCFLTMQQKSKNTWRTAYCCAVGFRLALSRCLVGPGYTVVLAGVPLFFFFFSTMFYKCDCTQVQRHDATVVLLGVLLYLLVFFVFCFYFGNQGAVRICFFGVRCCSSSWRTRFFFQVLIFGMLAPSKGIYIYQMLGRSSFERPRVKVGQVLYHYWCLFLLLLLCRLNVQQQHLSGSPGCPMNAWQNTVF